MVPNGSFEKYTTCPNTTGNINCAAPWCFVNDPDLFNACDNVNFPSYTGIPFNTYYKGSYLGYQYTHSGYGMVGLNVFAGHYFYRETPSVTLKDSLRGSRNYCINFYVNQHNSSKYAIDRIGMYISKTFHPCDTLNYNVTLTPTFTSPSGVFLTDTLNWMKISSVYTATGGEKYILIGNFYNDNNTNRILVNPMAKDSSAYYYLDDVSIEEIKPVIMKNDTTLTNCDSVLLGNNLDSASTYSWWPNKNVSDTTSPNPTAWPDSTTTYYVTKTQCSSVTTDSIKITVISCDVGMEKFQVPGLKVSMFPNPSSGTFYFDKNINETALIEVFDVSGKSVFTKNCSSIKAKEEIDPGNLNEGVYLIKVSGSKNVFHSSIVIQR